MRQIAQSGSVSVVKQAVSTYRLAEYWIQYVTDMFVVSGTICQHC